MSNRISQLPLEVLVLSDAAVSMRVSQVPLEILVVTTDPITLKLSQVAVEVLVLPSVAPAVVENTTFTVYLG